MSFIFVDLLGYELWVLRVNNVWKWDYLYIKGILI